MNAFFIVGNLKVNPFLLKDAPLPGFSVVAWDAYTVGSLWLLDSFDEVCFLQQGNVKVHGQIWKADKSDNITLLEKYSGKSDGLTDYTKVKLILPTESDLQLNALAFNLINIKPEYKKLNEGKWRF